METGKHKNIEHLLPEEIEKRSFEIIGRELSERGISLPKEEKMQKIIKRVIHTSADFDYGKTLCFSEHAVEILEGLLKQGADIVTDTNMALAGINKKVLAEFGGSAHCFMAEEEVARLAKQRGTTRAAVSMEKAAEIQKPVIFAIGNAPTALIQLYEMTKQEEFRLSRPVFGAERDARRAFHPAFIIGVPVGFVNVEAAKELILNTDIPYIINKGRKGGSNIAAAICNAALYTLRDHSEGVCHNGIPGGYTLRDRTEEHTLREEEKGK